MYHKHILIHIWISTCFLDQKDESFYTVSWACNVDGTPLLVAGGINGIIRVIDAGNEKIHKVYYFKLTFICRALYQFGWFF